MSGVSGVVGRRLVVNMASESDISVQGHGVHTAYVELATALEAREDVTLVRGRYGERVDCDVYHLHTCLLYTSPSPRD